MARTREPLSKSGCACGARTGCSCLNRTQFTAPPTGDVAAASRVVQQVVSARGHALDAGTRAFFEPRFDFDFSRVRVHTDTAAAASAGQVSARAYTVGRHIVFAAGEYGPESEAGRRLLAHELTHVVQNKQHAEGAPSAGLRLADPGGTAERDATRASGHLGLRAIGGTPQQTALYRQVATTPPSAPTPPPQPQRCNSPSGVPASGLCDKPESYYSARSIGLLSSSEVYCYDTRTTGKLHLGNYWNDPGNQRHPHPITRCYREVPTRQGRGCPPGNHVCFDSFGHCGDAHTDCIAPYDRDPKNGTCASSRCTLLHGAVDVFGIEPGDIRSPLDGPPRDDRVF